VLESNKLNATAFKRAFMGKVLRISGAIGLRHSCFEWLAPKMPI
jgi:hypothetical protein